MEIMLDLVARQTNIYKKCFPILQSSVLLLCKHLIFSKKTGRLLLNFIATVSKTFLGWDWWYMSTDICHPK